MLSPKQFNEFKEVSKLLIKWLNDNNDVLDPHTMVIVDIESAKLVEGLASIVIPEYVKD